MNHSMKAALYQAAALTFEELGFLFPNAELEPGQKSAVVDGMVNLDFYGPFNGSLILRVCGEILPTIAANMLGQDEPPSVALQQDVLGELGNVVCGNALPLIAGREVVFRLSPPCILGTESALENSAAQIQIGLEGGRADVFLFIKQ
jgi:CheY-specific phosphatase CheX